MIDGDADRADEDRFPVEMRKLHFADILRFHHFFADAFQIILAETDDSSGDDDFGNIENLHDFSEFLAE